MSSRRKFLTGSVVAASALIVPGVRADDAAMQPRDTEVMTLCGEWRFRADPQTVGLKESWHTSSASGESWRTVTVPHTWQIESAFADYRGVAWYWRSFDVSARWLSSAVRVEFEAVFHTATVWVNGQLVGEHSRKGYTAFTLDVAPALREGRNIIAVRVDNAFNSHMLPRRDSSDWANDGGIFRSNF
jgi:beta-glucuronidase